jgi:Ca-activated chloride channel family protein
MNSKADGLSLQYSEPLMTEDNAVAAVPADFNTEEYGVIVERGFVSPLSEPLSTFSIDVDTASYANMRRFVMNDQEVPADAVRIEEMINYFNYGYPEPQGEMPFSVYTELSDCPWNKDNKLLLIGLKGKEIDIESLPPSNLVFLIDVSGSMLAPNKLPLVQHAFLRLVEQLRPEDRISIVTYAGDDRVVLDGVSGKEKLKITEAIEALHAGGSTAGAKGIETAYEIAQKNFIKNGNNRVILATDGDFNVGVSSEGQLKRLIEKKRDKGIFLSVLGFGTGNIKDNKMETLADYGNGSYAYIDSQLEARKVLVEEMGGTLLTIAKDVKLQVEFNPEKVKGYRLIGYENRMLNAEDFDDDTKDAGEMGAGHRVTALYEIIPAGSDQAVEESTLKYQKTETTGSGEWATIHIRYKKPDEDTSILSTYVVDETREKAIMSEDFAFASAVAEFGLLLRDSEYKGNASFESVYGRIVGLPSVSNDVYKAEFLEIVQKLME